MNLEASGAVPKQGLGVMFEDLAGHYHFQKVLPDMGGILATY